MQSISIDIVLGVLTSLGLCVLAYTTILTKLEVQKLRSEVIEGRAKDREELRVWINGSFLRASVVELMHQELERRIEALEDSGRYEAMNKQESQSRGKHQ
jgi:hypothetical protein